MASCPICQAHIQDDFGLVTCPSCGAQVLLELEGNSTALKNEISRVIQADLLVELTGVEKQNPSTLLPADLSAEPSAEFSPVEPSNQALSAEVLPTELLAEKQEATPSPGDLSDIEKFGNSLESQGREGYLRYNLIVLGIDGASIRQQVEEALKDERFVWDAKQILATIKSGELLLSDLSAVKATILVQRLRAVPVQISWEQYVIF